MKLRNQSCQLILGHYRSSLAKTCKGQSRQRRSSFRKRCIVIRIYGSLAAPWLRMSVFDRDGRFFFCGSGFFLVGGCFSCVLLLIAGRLYLRAAHDQSANAKNNADIEAIDQGRRAASTDERERLPRDGCDAHGHEHIKQGLEHEHQGCAHYR